MESTRRPHRNPTARLRASQFAPYVAAFTQHLVEGRYASLQSGVDFSVIALCLGHESVNTTHRYVEADLAMKDKALARLQPPDTKMRRYRPPDALMQFLQGL
jgi:integrase